MSTGLSCHFPVLFVHNVGILAVVFQIAATVPQGWAILDLRAPFPAAAARDLLLHRLFFPLGKKIPPGKLPGGTEDPELRQKPRADRTPCWAMAPRPLPVAGFLLPAVVVVVVVLLPVVAAVEEVVSFTSDHT